MNNTILPIDAKVIDLSYCDVEPSNNLIELPVAEEVGNILIESVIAEQILTSTIDSKYIIIYRNGKRIKVITFIQMTMNLLFTLMYYIYYAIPTILAYVGYKGVEKYNFILMTLYLCYILLDFIFHLLYFNINFIHEKNFNNFLNGCIIIFQCYIFYISNNFTKSIKKLTIDEKNLLHSISVNNNIR